MNPPLSRKSRYEMGSATATLVVFAFVAAFAIESVTGFAWSRKFKIIIGILLI
jgi:hypothetical protein